MQLYFDNELGFILDCTPEEALNLIDSPDLLSDFLDSTGLNKIPESFRSCFYRIYLIPLIHQLSLQATKAIQNLISEDI